MPSLNIYEQPAKLNEDAAKSAHTEAPEWAIIMYFYAALHWINSYAYKRNEIRLLQSLDKTLAPHERRRRYVKKISNYTGDDELYISYKFLFDESMIARYLENSELECINKTSREYYQERDIKEFVDSLEILKRALKK